MDGLKRLWLMGIPFHLFDGQVLLMNCSYEKKRKYQKYQTFSIPANWSIISYGIRSSDWCHGGSDKRLNLS